MTFQDEAAQFTETRTVFSMYTEEGMWVAAIVKAFQFTLHSL